MRGALVVLLLWAQPLRAETPADKVVDTAGDTSAPADKVLEKAGGPSTPSIASSCDPREIDELRAHLDGQAHHARTWNLVWAAIFTGAAMGSFSLALANPFPDLQVGLYASAGKATVGALGRLILPLRIPRPDATGDACTDAAALRKAVALAAKRERGNFFLNHIGGALVNGAGALVIWKYSTGSQALLSIATGYAVGLLSNYTAPRGSWHLYRERKATWTTMVIPHEHGWTLGVAGTF
jgi:hypothetical protein